MFFANWLASLLQPQRRPLRNAKARRNKLHLERLEDRTVPALHTWTGLGADTNWSTAGNWTGGAPTVSEASLGPGNDIILDFPTGVSKLTTTDDIAGLTVDQIHIEGDGYAVKVANGVTLALRQGSDPMNPLVTQILAQGTATIAGGTITTCTDPSTDEAETPGLSIDPSKMLTISSVLADTSGVAGAAGYSSTGTGTLILSGNNTFAGLFDVQGGTLVVKSATALGTTAKGTSIEPGATLDVQANIGAEPLTFNQDGESSTLGNSLVTSVGTGTVNGPITLNFSNPTTSLQVLMIGGAGNLTIGGAITGSAVDGVTKIGAGKTILSGTNTYGPTTVMAGFLEIDGNQAANSVAMTGGTLGGRGTIGFLTATGGTVSTTVGSGAAPLIVAGDIDAITLTGATLKAVQTGNTVKVGTTIVIIRNNAPASELVEGTFNNLMEGATVIASNGQRFRISYVGGDGNDVTLKALSLPTNLPPVDHAPTSVSMLRNHVLSFVSKNRLSMSDPDAGTALMRVTLRVTHGTAHVSLVRGLKILGNSHSVMTLTGSAALINKALATLKFSPLHNFHGLASLTMIANDLGHTGLGGAKTATKVIKIDVK